MLSFLSLFSQCLRFQVPLVRLMWFSNLVCCSLGFRLCRCMFEARIRNTVKRIATGDISGRGGARLLFVSQCHIIARMEKKHVDRNTDAIMPQSQSLYSEGKDDARLLSLGTLNIEPMRCCELRASLLSRTHASTNPTILFELPRHSGWKVIQHS